MPVASLLVEVRTEELPPQCVPLLAAAFPAALLAALRKRDFADDKSTCGGGDPRAANLATNRRFAAVLRGIHGHSPQKTILRRGPQLAACYDREGAPTKALIGFMRGVGATCEKTLGRAEEKGREYVAYQQTRAAQALRDCLAAAVEEALLNIPAPRLMRWGDNTFKFIRPLRGLLMMHGDEVICSGGVMGVAASDHTVGHPVLADKKKIRFRRVEAFAETLEKEGKVVVNRAERKRRIEEKISTPSKSYYHGNIHGEYTPEDQNADTCEYPVVCEGKIDEALLALPEYCLVACMIKHQSAFLIWDKHRPTNRYQFVIDNEPSDERVTAAIVKGFNNVVHARLQDALFYDKEDEKMSQADAYAKLGGITYHRQLGSQQQRAQRLQKIIDGVAELVAASAEDQKLLRRAALLCKCGLPTLMVQEYPELAGRVAADRFCEAGTPLHEIVRRHNDIHMTPAAETPSENMSNFDMDTEKNVLIFMLVNQLEKLVGMFGVGEKPSGSKDPHGLRRAAQIVTDVLAERPHAIWSDGGCPPPCLKALINRVREAFADLPAFNEKEIRDYILERERSFVEGKRAKRVSADILNAVLANDVEYVGDVEKRAAALADFMERAEAKELIEINKRVNNILRKSAAQTTNGEVREALFENAAEKALHEGIKRLNTHVGARDERKMLDAIVSIKPAVDAFFDSVLVNAPDPAVRDNRFRLLAALRRLLTTVGDLSKLGGASSS